GDKSQQKNQGEHHDARSSRLVDEIGKHEDDHDQESQQRLRVASRGRSELSGLYHGFSQRNEMKHHAEVGGVERNFTEDFRGAGQRDQSIEQSRSVTNQRNPQPDQSHHSLFFISWCFRGPVSSPTPPG